MRTPADGVVRSQQNYDKSNTLQIRLTAGTLNPASNPNKDTQLQVVWCAPVEL